MRKKRFIRRIKAGYGSFEKRLENTKTAISNALLTVFQSHSLFFNKGIETR